VEKIEETTKDGSNPVMTHTITKRNVTSISWLMARYSTMITLARIHAIIKAITAGLRFPSRGPELSIVDNPMLTSAGAKTLKLIKGATNLCPSR